MKLYLLYIILALSMLLTACRTDDIIIYAEDEDTGVKAVTSEVIGMYILNEGNMGSNKCTLDYLDLSGNDSTIHYNRNTLSVIPMKSRSWAMWATTSKYTVRAFGLSSTVRTK